MSIGSTRNSTPTNAQLLEMFGIPKTRPTGPFDRVPDGVYAMNARSDAGGRMPFELRKAGHNLEVRLLVPKGPGYMTADLPSSGVDHRFHNKWVRLDDNHRFTLPAREVLIADGFSKCTNMVGTVAMEGDVIRLSVRADTTQVREVMTRQYYSDSWDRYENRFENRGRTLSPVDYEARTGLDGKDAMNIHNVLTFAVAGGDYQGTATLRTLEDDEMFLDVELKGAGGGMKFGVPVHQGGKIQHRGGHGSSGVLDVEGSVEQGVLKLKVTKGSVDFNDAVIISGSVKQP